MPDFGHPTRICPLYVVDNEIEHANSGVLLDIEKHNKSEHNAY